MGLHLLRVQRAAGQRPGAGQRGGSGRCRGRDDRGAGPSLPPALGVNFVRITCRRAQSRATGTRACDRVDCRKVLIGLARTRSTRRISRVQLRIPPRASLARCPTGRAGGPKAHGRSGSRNREHKLGRPIYGCPQCPSVEGARNLPDTRRRKLPKYKGPVHHRVGRGQAGGFKGRFGRAMPASRLMAFKPGSTLRSQDHRA